MIILVSICVGFNRRTILLKYSHHLLDPGISN